MGYIQKLRKKLASFSFYQHLSRMKQKLLIYRSLMTVKHRKALRNVNDKSVIRCVFMCLFEEVWKVDKVYKKMITDSRFDPIIIVCPVVNYGEENMVARMNQCYDYFSRKGYHVVKSYNEETNRYIDLRHELFPDIIFYTNPYRGLIDERYYITNFPDILTVYVPYYFNEGVGYDVAYNNLFQNLIWRRYVETDFHKGLSKKYGINRGKNSVVTGYPGIENLIDGHAPSDEIWPQKEKKRIIWAPHHSLEAVGTCNYSCFLQYSDFMLKMAQKYFDKIQIVFKPHPLLKNRLYKLWGKEKTDNYYNQWESLPNTALKEGEYIDLFLTSDAMIHDSGSFLIEYLYVNKPVMRTLNGIPLERLYNEFALECLKYYYLAENEEIVEQFIQNVINGVDPLKEQRTKFINDVLMPKGSPSQNIIDDILYSIDNQILYRN